MKTTAACYSYSFKTRFGIFQLRATRRGLYALEFGKSPARSTRGRYPAQVRRLLDQTARRIQACLKGEQVTFVSVPIDWREYRPFEKKVLQMLRTIPWGCTATYQDLAARAGRPRTVRYVGRILHLNRLPLVLPCHRIVRKGGGLGGFSEGGRWKKRLLKIEEGGVDKMERQKPPVYRGETGCYNPHQTQRGLMWKHTA